MDSRFFNAWYSYACFAKTGEGGNAALVSLNRETFNVNFREILTFPKILGNFG